MSIVAIVGAGSLGGTVAYALAGTDHVREIRLIDVLERVASGKALDIQQAGAVEPFTTTVTGHRDMHAALGAALIVLTGPAETPDTEWTEEPGIDILRQLAAINRHAVVVCAGAGHRRLVERGVADTVLPRHRLIGSAPLAYQSAVRAITALELRCSPLEISLTVLGVPPDRVIVPWSQVLVGGTAITGLLSPPRLGRLRQRVSHLWPPGPYALAAATAHLCNVVVRNNTSRGVPCFVVLEGELGVMGKAAAVTATLGRTGVTAVREPTLTTQERMQFESAVQPSYDAVGRPQAAG